MKTLKIILTTFVLLSNISDINAIEINKIILKGNTIDLDIKERLINLSGSFKKEDIEALAVEITDEYHDRGYTTSYVKDLVLETDKTLIIYIKESRIAGINISGVDENEKKEIQKIIFRKENEIYNKNILKKRSEIIKAKYNLESVKIYPVNFKDTGDVFLTVKVEKKTRGRFYGGIGIEPIYGISPELGYFYSFDSSFLNLQAGIGYRDNKFRKLEGDIKYHYLIKTNMLGLFTGVNAKRRIDIWMTPDKEYSTITVSPVIGCRYLKGYMVLELYIKELFNKIENYNIEDEEFRDYDTRLTLDMEFSNKIYKIRYRDISILKLSISGGRSSSLAGNGYIISTCRMKGALSIFSNLKLIPRANIYYTTSGERHFWNYVYDISLLGFPDDYTASMWKNTAGLDIEYEVSPDFFFAGIFVNAGYFKNEEKDWEYKTSGGIKGEVIYRKMSIDIYFAWDLLKGPSEGELYILAGGRI